MSDVFVNDITFDQLGLRGSVLKGVEAAGFAQPTVIQHQLIPAIFAGHDVIGQAKTGTGKTAAFALPLLCNATRDVSVQALILAPTRELAAQIAGEINTLGKHTPIKATAIVGGESQHRQVRAVASGAAHLVVGTPGRVLDLHDQGKLPFDQVRWVVLDEVDRMLDIGFRDDIRKLLGKIKHDHQTIFVSATISEDIERLARQFMRPGAQKLQTVAASLTVAQVRQYCLAVPQEEKKRVLAYLLTHEEPAMTVIFCRTKMTVRRVTKYLREHGIDAHEIHGDLAQGRRNRVMRELREGQLGVLVASDLAARGLDVEGISHVINYDLPEDPEIYVHRIGRTARAGRSGIAWSFVTPGQGKLLTEIEKLIGAMIEEMPRPAILGGPRDQQQAQLEAQEAAEEETAVDPEDYDDSDLGTDEGVPVVHPEGEGGEPRRSEGRDGRRERGPRREGRGDRGPRRDGHGHDRGPARDQAPPRAAEAPPAVPPPAPAEPAQPVEKPAFRWGKPPAPGAHPLSSRFRTRGR